MMKKEVMTKAVLPGDTNARGVLFGGKLMGWLDELSGITAFRYVKGDVATVSVEKVAFLLPIPMGAFIDITAEVVYVGNTSLRVEMNVWLDQHDGKNVLAGKAEFVYVALDKQGKPRKITRAEEE